MGLLQHTKSRRSSGFGLIELVITIAIVAILTAIALPSFANSIRGNRVSTQTNELLSALNYARNESITRTRGVTLCPADTTTGVEPTECLSGAGWGTGWMVFVDDTVGAAAPVIGDDGVLRTWVGNPHLEMTSEQEFVRFNPRGQVVAAAEFVLRPESSCASGQQRRIAVSALGRSNASKENCP